MGYRIFVNGTEYDSSVEFELHSDVNTLNGYNAHVILGSGDSCDYHNCTEIHHLYKSNSGDRIAFESDIHSTGCTLDVNRISYAYITTALKEHNEF